MVQKGSYTRNSFQALILRDQRKAIVRTSERASSIHSYWIVSTDVDEPRKELAALAFLGG